MGAGHNYIAYRKGISSRIDGNNIFNNNIIKMSNTSSVPNPKPKVPTSTSAQQSNSAPATQTPAITPVNTSNSKPPGLLSKIGTGISNVAGMVKRGMQNIAYVTGSIKANSQLTNQNVASVMKGEVPSRNSGTKVKRLRKYLEDSIKPKYSKDKRISDLQKTIYKTESDKQENQLINTGGIFGGGSNLAAMARLRKHRDAVE